MSNPYNGSPPCNNWSLWNSYNDGRANIHYQRALQEKKNRLLDHPENEHVYSKKELFKSALGKTLRYTPYLSGIVVVPMVKTGNGNGNGTYGWRRSTDIQESNFDFDKTFDKYSIDFASNFVDGFQIKIIRKCNTVVDVSGIISSFGSSTLYFPSDITAFEMESNVTEQKTYNVRIVSNIPGSDVSVKYNIVINTLPPSPLLSKIQIIPRVVYKSGISNKSEFIWNVATSIDASSVVSFDVKDASGNFTPTNYNYYNQILDIDVARAYGDSGANFFRTAGGYQIVATAIDPKTEIDIKGGYEFTGEFLSVDVNDSSLTFDASNNIAYPPGSGFPDIGLFNTSVQSSVTSYDNVITTRASNGNTSQYFVQIRTT